MKNNQKTITFMKLRERVQLTQRELAEALGVTITTISAWENGRHEPKLTLPQTKRLMELLKCSLDELVEAVGNTERHKKQN